MLMTHHTHTHTAGTQHSLLFPIWMCPWGRSCTQRSIFQGRENTKQHCSKTLLHKNLCIYDQVIANMGVAPRVNWPRPGMPLLAEWQSWRAKRKSVLLSCSTMFFKAMKFSPNVYITPWLIALGSWYIQYNILKICFGVHLNGRKHCSSVWWAYVSISTSLYVYVCLSCAFSMPFIKYLS